MYIEQSNNKHINHSNTESLSDLMCNRCQTDLSDWFCGIDFGLYYAGLLPKNRSIPTKKFAIKIK